jgi:DnaK suppressor protein
MTDEQKQQLLAKIETEITQTEQRIEELVELTKPIAPDNAIGRVSRMDAINNRSINESGLRQARSRLNKLQRQLERSRTAEFGYCSRCGQEIRFERLMYLPESFKCVSCARRE